MTTPSLSLSADIAPEITADKRCVKDHEIRIGTPVVSSSGSKGVVTGTNKGWPRWDIKYDDRDYEVRADRDSFHVL
jgi:hypothetical protein